MKVGSKDGGARKVIAFPLLVCVRESGRNSGAFPDQTKDPMNKEREGKFMGGSSFPNANLQRKEIMIIFACHTSWNDTNVFYGFRFKRAETTLRLYGGYCLRTHKPDRIAHDLFILLAFYWNGESFRLELEKNLKSSRI